LNRASAFDKAKVDMKRIACLILFVFTLLEARADNWLQNSDFSAGNDHWYGDAQWPSDFAAADPFAKPDPFTSHGMIFPLKSEQWLKAFQDFTGHGQDAVLKISYILSPNLTFSSKPEDYQNMPDKIGWDGWKAFNTPPNSWVVFISELVDRHGTYSIIKPIMGSTKEQTCEVSVHSDTPLSRKTIALAFPPGNGTVVIHSIEIDSQ
jgi:hypothetical protein